jgi:hypothetical protein
MINAGFGLGELAIEAGLRERRRPGPGPWSPPPVPQRLHSQPGAAPGELVAREIAVFITGNALITAGKGCRARVMLTGGPGLRWR